MTLKSFRFFASLLFVCSAISCTASGYADNGELNRLPVKQQEQTSVKKAKQAKLLSQWVIKTLEEKHVQVALITREGPPLTHLFDRTGMTHSGFVFRSPETGQWITYSLYSNPDEGYKTSKLWQETVDGFYYGQSGKKTDAVMLIPSKELQEKLLARLTAHPFKTLLPADEGYNLIAPIQSVRSFNCTKWVLLQLYAAQYNTDHTAELIEKISTHFKVPTVYPPYLVRRILKKKPDVNWQELTPPNRIHTVSVTSLSQSKLFEEKVYYHAR